MSAESLAASLPWANEYMVKALREFATKGGFSINLTKMASAINAGRFPAPTPEDK